MRVKEIMGALTEGVFDARKIAADIAAIQEKRRVLVDEAFYADEQLATQEYKLIETLKKATMAGQIPPGEAAVAIIKAKVAVSDEFDGRFVDWMKAKGAPIAPEKYAVQRSKVAFVDR